MDFGNTNGNIIGTVMVESDAATVSINTPEYMVTRWDTTQNVTINFVTGGHFALISIGCDATPRTVTFGTNAHTGSHVLTASKKNILRFEWDGLEYVLTGTQALA